MRQKIDPFERKLDKSKKLPGPGLYSATETIGKAASLSTIKNFSKFSVPKAQDRFRVSKFLTPDPARYDPRNNLNQNFNSQHRYDGGTKVGLNSRTFVDTTWNLRKQLDTPGPGMYGTFSDFSGYQKGD